MAVDRWFGGIKAKYNYWMGTTFIAPANKDSYLMNYHVSSTDTTNGAEFTIFATPECTEKNPAKKEIVITHHAKITAWEDALSELICQLEEGTRMFPVSKALNAGAAIQSSEGVMVILPKSGKGRTANQIIAEMNCSNTTIMFNHITTADTNEHILEFEIDSNKEIIQPFHQATPAVADQLLVSSTSANDTLLGSGARKIIFDYYDASNILHEDNEIEMNGQTPVDIVALYANVAYIKRAYVSQTGASGYNEGDIFFHDAA